MLPSSGSDGIVYMKAGHMIIAGSALPAYVTTESAFLSGSRHRKSADATVTLTIANGRRVFTFGSVERALNA
jgi:hypothetical protein